MKEIKVVIGKNFGDEGKGQATYLLCKEKNAVVVRHNGGAQAGHTVEEGNFLFVFHQLGSGSMLNAATYWSATFLPDLLKLGEEVEELREEMKRHQLGDYNAEIFADGDCRCTVVYDVLLNSLTEQLRGSEKHGSCGMGIFEAITRSKEKEYILRLRDFSNASLADIQRKLKEIRDEYVLPRVEKLQKEFPKDFLKEENQYWVELIRDQNLLENAAAVMYENFNRYVVISDFNQVCEQYETIIFENAQGLMLDEENIEYFPHLTPSHTGLYNVAELIFSDKCKKTEQTYFKEEPSIEIYYATRTYVTRHGAGRLDYECKKAAINEAMQDFTNCPNPWQGNLRYARHPKEEDFFRYIEKDAEYFSDYKGKINWNLLVTHWNETDEKFLFAETAYNKEELKTLLQSHLTLKLNLKSIDLKNPGKIDFGRRFDIA